MAFRGTWPFGKLGTSRGIIADYQPIANDLPEGRFTAVLARLPQGPGVLGPSLEKAGKIFAEIEPQRLATDGPSADWHEGSNEAWPQRTPYSPGRGFVDFGFILLCCRTERHKDTHKSCFKGIAVLQLRDELLNFLNSIRSTRWAFFRAVSH